MEKVTQKFQKWGGQTIWEKYYKKAIIFCWMASLSQSNLEQVSAYCARRKVGASVWEKNEAKTKKRRKLIVSSNLLKLIKDLTTHKFFMA